MSKKRLHPVLPDFEGMAVQEGHSQSRISRKLRNAERDLEILETEISLIAYDLIQLKKKKEKLKKKISNL